MKSTNSRFRRITSVAVALIVVMSVFGPVGTAAAQPSVTMTQTIQSGSSTVSPGDNITVEATLDYSNINSPGINATLPPGWTITNHTDDGGQYAPAETSWVWLEGDTDGVNGSHTVTYTVEIPSDASSGDYTLSTAGDGIDPSDSSFVTDTADLTITVQTNDAPSADAGDDQMVAEGASVTLDAGGSSDPDAGDSLTFSWTVVDDAGTGVSLTDASAQQPTFTAPDVNSDTTLTFEVTVDDGQATDTDLVNVTVQPVNDAPMAMLTANKTSVNVSEAISFDASGSTDSDGSIQSYAWDFGDGDTATGATPSHTYTSAGTYQVNLTVTDDDGATANATTTITVTEPATTSILYRVNTAGPKIEVQDGPNWTADNNTNPSQYLQVQADLTEHDQQFGVTDSVPSGTPDQIFVTERWPASGSTLEYAFPVTQGETYEVRLYFIEQWAPNNQEGTRIFDVTAEGQTVLNDYDIMTDVGFDNATMKSFEVTADDGSLDISLVKDGGSANPFIYGIEVLEPSDDGDETDNQAPSASFTASPTVVEIGQSVSFDASASSDSDGSISSYEWNFGDGSSTTGVTTSHTYSSTGTYTVELNVTDDEGASATATKSVTVIDQQTAQIVYRLNGGDSTVQAIDGGPDWEPDAQYEQGTVGMSDWSGETYTVGQAVPATTPDGIFESERYSADGDNTLEYDLPVTADETYEVRLYFIEQYSQAQNPGDRILDISLEGSTVLNDYDIVGDVGFKNATMESFEVTPTDGNIDLSIAQDGGSNNALIYGIEVLKLPAVNEPPIADAGADKTVSEGASVTLDASGSSDPDTGDSLNYSWSVTDAAGTGVSLTDNNTATPSFTAPDVNSDTTLTFEVTVDDGQASATDTVNVTVSPLVLTPTVSISQTVTSSTPVTPGGTVTVETTIDYSDINGPGINVTLPAGWTVTSHTDDGGTYGPPAPTWAWTEGDIDGIAGSHTVTYTVEIPSDASSGDYTLSAEGIAIDPSDGSFVSATDDLSVTVQGNQAPSASFTASATDVETGQSISFDATDSSDDGSIASYSWDFGDGDTATGATPSHTYTSAGTYQVNLTVTDDDGATANATKTVTVSAPPTLNPTVSISQAVTSSTPVAPGGTVTVEATIDYNDVNAPGINVTLPAGWTVTSHTDDNGTYGPPQPSWAWIEGDEDGVSGNHTVTYTVEVPSDASPGDYILSAESSSRSPDGSPANDTDDLTITVEPVNAPPSADAGDDQTVDENDPVELNASDSSDPNGDSLTYSWTVVDDAGTGVSLTDAGTVTPTFTAPSVSTPTTLTFQIEVDDGELTDTDTINVTIQPVNDAPTADAGPDQTVDEGDSVGLDASGSSDPDTGDTLSYTWTQTDGPPVTLTDADTATPTFTAPDVDSDTTLTFEVTVTDSDGATDADLVNVTVQSVNTPPTADAGDDQTVDEGDSVELNASDSSDPDGSVVSYSWIVEDDAGTGVSLTDEDTATPSFTAPDVDSDTTLTFEVTVDDGQATDTDLVNVTIQSVNAPPNADAGDDQTVDEDTPVTLDASGSSDPDTGDTLSYSWSVTDAAGTGVSLTNVGTATPSFTAPEVDSDTTLTFEVMVDDGQSTDTDLVNVTVEDTNVAPTAVLTANTTSINVSEVVGFNASGSSDPDGSIASYSWEFGDGSTATGATPSHSYTSPGTYQVNLTVTDDDGATANATKTVTVSAAPTLTPTVSISQTVTSSTPVAPGGTVTVEATIDYNDINSPGINATLPAGWTVTSHTDDGGTYGPPAPSWGWLEGDADGVAGSHTVTYTVGIPSDANEGDYTLSAEGSGIDPSDSSFVNDTDDLTVTVQAVNEPPVANAGQDQTVAEGDLVTLDASGSDDPDAGDTLNYSWTVTDTAGKSVSLTDANTATPSFTAPDVDSETTLSFELEVTDNDGATDTDTVNVTVQPTEPPNLPPIASFTVSSTDVDTGQSVIFNASGSNDSDGSISSFNWDFDGDGTTDATGMNVSHSFANAGTYQVNLTVTDDDGATATTSKTISVNANAAPTVVLTANKTSANVSEAVGFDASGSSDSDGSIASYSWEFGDGSTATDATPSHSYTSPGTYQVNLTVTDNEGATANATKTVTVSAAPTPDPTVSVSQAVTSSTPVSPGGTVTVEATIDYNDINSPGINATLPAGWTVTSHTDDGGTYGPPAPSWGWLEGDADGVAGSHTVTYTVEIPSDTSAGDYTLTADGSGIDPSDGSFVNDTDDLTVTVQAPENPLPTASFTASTTTPDVGQQVNFDASGSSDDGSIDSYEWEFGDGTTASGPTPSHSYTSAGTYQVNLTVTDDDGATATTSKTITVNANAAPTAVLTANTTSINVSEAVGFDASGSSDPDGSIASYSWEFGDGSTATGAAPTHSYTNAGTYQVNLTVTDDDGATDTATTSVTVSAAPTPDPTVSISQTVTSSTPVSLGETITVEATLEYSDINSPGIDVTLPAGWTVTSHTDDGGTYGPPAPSWAWLEGDEDGVAGTHTVTYTVEVPSDASPGDYTLSADGSGIDPSDGSSVTDTDDLTVTVAAPENVPPIADAGDDQTVDEGDGVTLDASGSSDLDGDTLTYMWSQTGGPSVPLTDANTATPTFTAPSQVTEPTTLTFEVKVSDGELNDTDTVTVTVQPVNDPPVADAGDDQSVDEGNSATLDASDSSDPDGDMLSYTWDQTAGPSVTLTDADTATPTFTAPAVTTPTTLTFEVEVSDGQATDSDTVTVTIQPVNDAPIADAGLDQSVDEGDGVTLDASGSSDPNGDTLSYTWTQTSGPSVSLSDISAAQPTFTAPSQITEPTTLAFELEVDDGQATDTDTVTVTVQPVNEPPTASFIVSPSAPETGQTVTFDASGSTDPDGSIQSYQWMIETAGEQTTTLLESDFEEGSLSAAGWSHAPQSPDAGAGVSDATANSGTQSAFHQGGAGSLVSPAVDASSSQSVTVEYWVQKGDDSFSENPDADQPEDLIVEYLSANGNWVEIGRVESSVASGATVTESVTLSATDALHDGFQIRFRQESGTSPNGDYWHVDDVSITAESIVKKSGETVTTTFEDGGEFNVTLTVTDDEGATATATESVSVNEPPTASFTVSPSAPETGQTVTFDASGSTDPDGSIQSYQWMFTKAGLSATLLESDFEEGSLSAAGWSHAPQSPDAGAGVSDATANSGTQSAFHNGGAGSLVSPAVDASGATSVTVEYWIQKGAESFSENPDADQPEDMIVEYLSANGNWVEIDRVESSVASGAVTTGNMTLSATDALHDGFQIRFRQESGSAPSGDYWHVDDVSITAGSVAKKSGETVTNTFQNPGTYDVMLTVTDDEGATATATKSVSVSAPATGSLAFNDQSLGTDDTVIVENVSTSQPSTVVVTYTNESGAVIVAGIASADTLDDQDVSVTIQDAGGFPGEHTAWVFDDDDLAGLNLAPGDDILAATGLSASEVQDLAFDFESADVTLQPIGVFENPPTDPDNDGKFEDLNGDGDVNVGDVQALFANKLDPVIQNNVAAFDFNNDGEVNVGDVQALFAKGIGV